MTYPHIFLFSDNRELYIGVCNRRNKKMKRLENEQSLIKEILTGIGNQNLDADY